MSFLHSAVAPPQGGHIACCAHVVPALCTKFVWDHTKLGRYVSSAAWDAFFGIPGRRKKGRPSLPLPYAMHLTKGA